MNQIRMKTKETVGRSNIPMLSPMAIVPVVFLTAIMFTPLLGAWTWVPVLLTYWGAIGAILFRYGGKQNWKGWLKRPIGKWLWSVLPFVFVLMTLPMLFGNMNKLWSAEIFIPWLLVGLINPILEEGYWRGLLQDRRGKLPIWLTIAYSSILFSMNHLALGINSIACRNPVFLINTLVLGVVYSLVYFKTKSLIWLIITHSLMDLLGLSVLCFLNIFIPPSFG